MFVCVCACYKYILINSKYECQNAKQATDGEKNRSSKQILILFG